jgi:hypothetical protein
MEEEIDRKIKTLVKVGCEHTKKWIGEHAQDASVQASPAFAPFLQHARNTMVQTVKSALDPLLRVANNGSTVQAPPVRSLADLQTRLQEVVKRVQAAHQVEKKTTAENAKKEVFSAVAAYVQSQRSGHERVTIENVAQLQQELTSHTTHLTNLLTTARVSAGKKAIDDAIHPKDDKAEAAKKLRNATARAVRADAATTHKEAEVAVAAAPIAIPDEYKVQELKPGAPSMVPTAPFETLFTTYRLNNRPKYLPRPLFELDVMSVGITLEFMKHYMNLILRKQNPLEHFNRLSSQINEQRYSDAFDANDPVLVRRLEIIQYLTSKFFTRPQGEVAEPMNWIKTHLIHWLLSRDAILKKPKATIARLEEGSRLCYAEASRDREAAHQAADKAARVIAEKTAQIATLEEQVQSKTQAMKELKGTMVQKLKVIQESCKAYANSSTWRGNTASTLAKFNADMEAATTAVNRHTP